MVQAHAEITAKTLMDNLTTSKELTNYLAAMQLVSGEENAS